MEQTPLKSPMQALLEQKELATDESHKYVTVTCRLKPLLLQEERSKIEIDKHLHQITMNDPTKSISKAYTFDQVFDQTVCQDRFANSICNPLIKFFKNGGESGLIFSYGITNSGKTYTILGTNEQPGILLTLIKKLEGEFPEEPLRIVACELYKDEFMSLKNKGQKLHPKEVKGTISFDDCDSDQINEANMEELFEKYLQNRSCSSTFHNNLSSRSHAIFKITTQNFKIGIVDLAGSQRTSKNGDHVVDMKETVFINSSLLTLKKCIKILEERSFATQKLVVPYRESKLTQALMEYFVNNSKINIIVNINQAKHCLQQNLNAMDYTSKAKNITANATSDFSKMLKSTAKKKNDMFSALKVKTFQSATHEAKRHSAEFEREKKCVIDEDTLENQDIEASFQREIEMQQRRSYIMRRQNEQMIDQIMESPFSIEEFIKRQQNYREIYLSTDNEIQRESDERKLSALRKVNLLQTTQKKEQSEKKLVNSVEMVDNATDSVDLIDQDWETNRVIANLNYEKLRTAAKKKLMEIYDEEIKKKLLDAETMYSEKKLSQFEKVEISKIQETEVEDEQSNYTTPGKSKKLCPKLARSLNKSGKSAKKQTQGKSIFKHVCQIPGSVMKSIKSGYNTVSNSIFKSKKKPQNAKPNSKRFNMQIGNAFSELIQPLNKITYEISTQTEVDIFPSSKKVHVLQNQPKINIDGDVEIDANSELVYKQVTIQMFEVGIQTDDIVVNFAFQGSVKKIVEEEKQKIKHKKDKKHKKYQKEETTSTFCETFHEEIEGNVKEIESYKGNETNNVGGKTAFKHFSINKRTMEVSMKKHKAFVSAAKLGIAKNTRGAQKRRVNN